MIESSVVPPKPQPKPGELLKTPEVAIIPPKPEVIDPKPTPPTDE